MGLRHKAAAPLLSAWCAATYAQPDGAPQYQVDALWPKPLPGVD